MPEAIKARYMGDGSEFLNGIVAGDHTEAEYDALDPEARVRMHNAKRSDGKPLYQIRTDAEMHPSRHEADAAKPAAKKGGE
jgi:hypothetical protein